MNLLKIFSKLIKLVETSLVSEAISLSGIIVVDDDRLNQGKSLKTNLTLTLYNRMSGFNRGGAMRGLGGGLLLSCQNL